MIKISSDLHRSIRYPCPILMKLEFALQVLEKYSHISSFTKIPPVVTEFFHVDGRTEEHITNLIVAFRNFVKLPKTTQTLWSAEDGLELRSLVYIGFYVSAENCM